MTHGLFPTGKTQSTPVSRNCCAGRGSVGGAVSQVVGTAGDVPDYRLRQWLTELAQRVLMFLSGESPFRWMSLHDVPQKYLREQVQNPAALHRDWLRSYGGGKFPLLMITP